MDVSSLRSSLTALLDARTRRDAPDDGEFLEAQARLHPVLFDAETAAGLESLAGQTEGGAHAVLGGLAYQLRLWQRLRAGGPAEQEARARDQLPEVLLPDGRMSLAEALRRLPVAESREERAATEKAADRFLRERPQPELRRLEAWLSAPSPGQLPEWQEAARTFLDRTRDAFEDVLLFVLRRSGVVPGASRLEDVAWHDLAFLQHRSLREAPFFVPEGAQLVSAATAWMEAWRWPPLRPELSGPPQPGFSAAGGHPPRLRLYVAPGWRAGSALLDAVADFQRVAHVQPDDPPEARDLVAPAVREATCALFRRQREEPGWLRRLAQQPREVTRDGARIAAALELLWLRETVGRALYEDAFFRNGPDEHTVDLFEQSLFQAVGVRPPRGFHLHGLSAVPGGERFLGALLGAQWMQALRERFDDDYFRNPAAGVFVARRWARGAREDGEGLYRALAPTEPAAPQAKSEARPQESVPANAARWRPEPGTLISSFLTRLNG